MTAASATTARHDATVAGLVGVAHFGSHFYQLALPPTFLMMQAEFGVSFVQLGLIVAVFYVTSGICQAFAGILVDRFGGRLMLSLGLALAGGSIAMVGLAPVYWMTLPLAALAGVGNSVFHPADFSILTAKVDHGRLGRAYSAHALMGSLGYAAAPVVVGVLAVAFDWRVALLVAGSLGVIGALALSRVPLLFVEPSHKPRADGGPGAATFSYGKLIATPAIVLAFGYFALTAASGIGLQAFSPAALVTLHGVEIALANAGLTAYLVCSAAGMAMGGIIADRTTSHHHVASAGLAGAAVFIALVGVGGGGPYAALLCFALAGLCVGVTAPSRDMLVRAATPPGATGKVFGFVYSGLDIGALFGPVLFGWFLDHHRPEGIFLGSAVLLVLGIATVQQVRRRSVPREARTA